MSGSYSVGEEYRLSYSEFRRLHRRAYRAQQRDHSEVCGLLGVGDDGHITLFFLKNRSAVTGHFEIDEQDVVDARYLIRREGKRLLGTFHSHPVSEANPGKSDLEGEPEGSLLLIYDVCGLRPKLWRVVSNSVGKVGNEVALRTERTPRRPLRNPPRRRLRSQN